MFEITALIDKGVGNHGNDDRALIMSNVIKEGGPFVILSEHAFGAVFDGVGGEAFGFEAAEIAANSFAQLNFCAITENDILYEMTRANSAIIARQLADAKHAGMSSTIAGIYVWNNGYLAFNVGDSRVYMYRPPYITQLSVDHSLATLSSDGMKLNDANAHVITRCLGSSSCAPHIDNGTDLLCDGDVFMVCTDGISDMFSLTELESRLAEATEYDEFCLKLVDEAKVRGSRDNLSIVVIRRVS